MVAWGDPEPAPEPEPQAALEKLAAELDRQRYAASLVTGAGRRSSLRVTNRAAAQLTETSTATANTSGGDGLSGSRPLPTSQRRGTRSRGCCVPWTGGGERAGRTRLPIRRARAR